MNINELREELELNKEYIQEIKIYLKKGGTTKARDKQFYNGFLTVKDNPLLPLTAELQLINKSVESKTGETFEIKRGNFTFKPAVTFDESEPPAVYGKAFEEKDLIKLDSQEFIPNQIQVNRFELVLFGEKVLSLPFSGYVAEKTGNFCLKFNNYPIESYETAKAKDEARNTDYASKVLEYCFEPAKTGWSWEDLAAFAESQLEEYPDFEQFIKENFPFSGYEARKLKLKPAAQAIFDRVQARKNGVSQLNAQRARVVQGSLDLAKASLAKDRAMGTAVETEEIPF
jgi:hypothetical protein